MRVVTVLLAGMALLLVLFAACSDDPYPVQPSSNSSLLSFALAGVAGSIDATVVPHRIDVVLPEGQSLSSLIATFTLPAGARAYVNTVEQKSGASALSYDKGYLSWVIKAADGALREYRVYAWAGAISSTSASSLSSGTSTSTSASTTSGGISSSQVSATSSSGSVASAVSAASPVGKLLITEWADGTCDYIELRNFHTEPILVSQDITINYAVTRSISLTKYGTGTNHSEFIPIGTGVVVQPGEVIIVVGSTPTTTGLKSITDAVPQPPSTKIFCANAYATSTLIDSTMRLDDAPAKLVLGADEWSLTPSPFTAGTSTYSLLNAGFILGTDSTSDASKWSNGTSSIKTTGYWP